jgi:general secretion pathway protein I
LFHMARSKHPREAGFTIIEALVALAIVAATLAAIGRLIATSARGSSILVRHVELIETARAIESTLPTREELAGSSTGERAGYHWRVDVVPFAVPGIDPGLPSPWAPQTVVVTLRSPAGPAFQLTTVRLRRKTKE